MNEKILPDDPRVTAYALGELEGAERAEIEAAVQRDPALRAAVEEIRAMARQLEESFSSEPLPEVKPIATASEKPHAQKTHAGAQGKLLRFPQLYYVVGGLAAACFAVMLAWNQPELERREAERRLAMEARTRELAESAALQRQREAVMLAMPAAPREQGFRDASHPIMARKAAPAALLARVDARLNTESYAYRAESDFLSVAQNPLSTFSADVDTASYANVRRFLRDGRRPPVDAVRIEEMLNYFPYRYAPPPTDSSVPFAASMEVAEAPWAPEHRLVRIGLKGREIAASERGAANLVFLLDVSGSMNAPNKLPLVKESMRLLLGRLRPDDRVAIVTYASGSGLALPSTPAAKASKIMAALDELHASGSTNGAMGLELAYEIAKANFVPGGLNRVVLCTDGDFNVGPSSEGELHRLITEKAKSGVFLTVLGFGMGNYKDATLQQLADAGNGNYGYIDTRREAEKLLVEQVSGTLVTIAKDVKFQVEFNPAKVASYRLIGYEKRLLKKEDFNNDAVDAGEIGAGHTVTALYEIVPTGTESSSTAATDVDDLKYTTVAPRSENVAVSHELLTLKIRYKEPEGTESKKLEFPLVDDGRRFADASEDFQFAAAVAGLGMILRDSPHRGSATLAGVTSWAERGARWDVGGYRAEFLTLVRQAEAAMQ